MLSEQMEIIADQIEGTDPLEMDDEERTPATNDDAGESLRERRETIFGLAPRRGRRISRICIKFIQE